MRSPPWSASTSALIHSRPLARALCAAAFGILVASSSGGTDLLDEALEVQHGTDQHTIATQARIDALDDEARAAWVEYRRANEEAAALSVYNEQLERLLASQAEEQISIQRQLDEIGVTQRSIFPLMERMRTVLEQFVELDAPFLQEERRLRVQSLAEVRDRADISLAEKFRRLIEAYQIEADYGRTVEAYRASLPIGGSPTTVDVLRFGRVGLYYLTLDGQSSGMWDRSARAWQPLPDEYRSSVRQGLAMARRQTAPQLLRLPVVTGTAQ